MTESSASFETDSSADTPSSDSLGRFITDLRSGEEPSSLRAPYLYSTSMIVLSRESLIPAQVTPKKRRQQNEDQYTSVHHALALALPSDYSSSVYSERSSALAGTESIETTISSVRTDDVLMPKLLVLSKVTSMESTKYTPNAIGDHRSYEVGNMASIRVAAGSQLSNLKSEVQSYPSSGSESEALAENTVIYPVVEASSTHKLTQIPSPLANFFVNQKAAKLLGLDGAGSPVTPTTPIFSEVLYDIPNKEPMSSPHTLRNIASRLSLSSRKKSSQQEKEVVALGKVNEQAPSNLLNMFEEDNSPEASSSISRRRGFRPLSIHTGKAFDPFGFSGCSKPDLEGRKTVTDTPETVEADFATLILTTPPNVTHHPVFQCNPFSAKSPGPLMKTTSSPLQIRENRDRTSLSQCSRKDSSSGSKSGSARSKKKFIFDNELKGPKKGDGADPLDLVLSGSPLPRIRPSATPRESVRIAFAQHVTPRTSTSSDTNLELVDTTRRSRGISSWFRQRDKSAELSSNGYSIRERILDGESARETRIAQLRKLYDAPSPDYDADSPYPRHPVTGRSWNARNLKCTICRDHECSRCGGSCCIYRQAYITLGNPLSTTQSKEQAFGRMDQINRVFPDGRELPTFLQCTHGGGCGKYVCPECIGMCPLSICQDTQCTRCKADPWVICNFHDEEQLDF